MPAEVRVNESKAQRSNTTGHLVLIMPKVNPDENSVTIRREQREIAELRVEGEQKKVSFAERGGRRTRSTVTPTPTHRRRRSSSERRKTRRFKCRQRRSRPPALAALVGYGSDSDDDE